MKDKEASEELCSPDARIERPLSAALRTSAVAVGAFVVAAVPCLNWYRSDLSGAAWGWIAVIPLGMVPASFAYACVGAWYGRRKARRLVSGILAAGLVVGVYALTRYMDSR